MSRTSCAWNERERGTVRPGCGAAGRLAWRNWTELPSSRVGRSAFDEILIHQAGRPAAPQPGRTVPDFAYAFERPDSTSA